MIDLIEKTNKDLEKEIERATSEDSRLAGLIQKNAEKIDTKQDKLNAGEAIILSDSEVAVAFDKDTIILNADKKLSVNKDIFITSEEFNELKDDMIEADSELKAEIARLDSEKQDTLIAGDGIQIIGATISALFDEETLVLSEGKLVVNKDIFVTSEELREVQEDLIELNSEVDELEERMNSEFDRIDSELDKKQNRLVAGEGIILNALGDSELISLDYDDTLVMSEGKLRVKNPVPDFGSEDKGKALMVNSEGELV